MEINENDKFSIDKEELKNEASSTFNEVKETMKKVDLKNDTAETKGFIVEMFKNPIAKIKDVANSDGSLFKTAIILVIVWTLAVLIDSIFSWSNLKYFFEYNLFDNVLSLVKGILAPSLGIATMSVIVLIMNKSSKKSLTTVIATVAIAKIPTILASVVGLLTIISSQISKLTSPFTSFCSVISTILLYFSLKELYNEEDDNKFIKTIILIQGIYFIARFVISYLGIYI